MPLITLISDVGIHDFIPGAIKGRLLQYNPAFNIIDITQSLPAYNFPQAAYISHNVIANYPPGTLHLVLVNVFDTKPAHMLLARHNGQYIACADNGLLTMILEEEPQELVALPLNSNEPVTIFNCCGVVGNAFNKIQNGYELADVGLANPNYVIKNSFKPKLGADWMEGQIIFIDNFENVVVNIRQKEFEEHRRGREFKINFRRDDMIEKISECYADVQHGEKLAIFNAAGYLEIAINKGNAAGLFGLQGFSDNNAASTQLINNRLIYQMVKIFFE